VSRYLIDTNILSEPLKPQPNAGVMEQLELNTEEIAIDASEGLPQNIASNHLGSRNF
jgi:hypothetical protein